MDRYILKDREPVRCDGLLEWGTWFERADRTVARDMIGEVEISTIFLGIDHAFGRPGPLLFETMVFGSEQFEHEQERYRTWEEAERGHAEVVARVMAESAAKETPT